MIQLRKHGFTIWLSRVAILALLAAILSASRLSLYYATGLRETVQAPKRSDVIVLLSHGQIGSEWLSLVGAQRTLGALKLYRSGSARYVISSGRNPERRWNQAELQAEWLELAGVPREALVIEGNSRRTYSSAVEVSRVMNERGWRTMIVVASELDQRRIALIFRKLGYDPSFLLVPETGRPESWFSSDFWAIAYHATYEYAGILYYWWKGWL